VSGLAGKARILDPLLNLTSLFLQSGVPIPKALQTTLATRFPLSIHSSDCLWPADNTTQSVKGLSMQLATASNAEPSEPPICRDLSHILKREESATHLCW
jgi:hypothetical protein